jgi:Cytochrome c554 and c-prime
MAQPDPAIPRRPDQARAWKAVLVFVAVFVVILAISLGTGSRSPRKFSAPRGAASVAARARYVGSKSCAECHPGEFASHSRSGHARTLRPAARTSLAGRLSGETFADPERPGVHFGYSLQGGAFLTERREGDRVDRWLIDYAFGSGHHATTFVTLIDRTPDRPTILEHRLTAFAHRTDPDITPGQGQALGPDREGMEPSGRRYKAGQTLKCFECHTTVMSDRGPRELDESAMIANIGCERCHGPGQAHIEAARRGAGDEALAMPFGLDRWHAADEIQMCGACHRLPESVGPALVRPGNAVLVRFQPVGLMQSDCYKKSPGRLSCSTCHEPHARTSTDLVEYEAVCRSCHQSPSQRLCKLSPQAGCVGCHMPRRDASRGMMMTDHWIRSRPLDAAAASMP